MIKEGDNITLITKSDDKLLNLIQEGIVIKTEHPTNYGLKTNDNIDGFSPIYTEEINKWVYINGSDIKEKIILN